MYNYYSIGLYMYIYRFTHPLTLGNFTETFKFCQVFSSIIEKNFEISGKLKAKRLLIT